MSARGEASAAWADRWIDTRLQAHHAVQLLASFAGEFLEPRDDDGHRSLCWVAEQSVLATGSAERGDAPLTVTFDPATFVLGLRLGAFGGAGDAGPDADRDAGLAPAAATHSVELSGRTLSDARAWLRERITDATGIAPTLAAPEYTIPTHPVARDTPFAPDEDVAAELRRWFATAAAILLPFADRRGAGPLRCWPHHLDIATLIEVHSAMEVHPATEKTSARTVGVGMTPGDESIPLPYGYVTPYPYPWERARPPLDFGHWHTEGWLGAVLPADAWTGEGGSGRAERFFEQAVRVAGALLTPP